MNTYHAVLYYGYDNDWENGEVFHSFELGDESDRLVPGEMADKLSGMLDLKPDDDRFNWNFMFVELPEKLVKRIKEDAVAEYRKENA